MSYDNVKFTADLNQFAADLQSEWEDYTDRKFDDLDISDSVRDYIQYESDLPDTDAVQDAIESSLYDHVSEYHGGNEPGERITSDDVESISYETLVDSLRNLRQHPDLADALWQALLILLLSPSPAAPAPLVPSEQAPAEFHGEGSANV